MVAGSKERRAHRPAAENKQLWRNSSACVTKKKKIYSYIKTVQALCHVKKCAYSRKMQNHI